MNIAQVAYTSTLVNNSIETILDEGAQRLYNKYLQQKLPQHTFLQNQTTMVSNLKLDSIQQPQTNTLQIVRTKSIRSGPRDNFVTASINIRKHQFNQGYSTLSPKNTTIDKSTKYGTIVVSQRSNKRANNSHARDANDSMFTPDQNDSPIFKRKQRPSTIQGGRLQSKDFTPIQLQSKLYKVEEKRAVTCHPRKRKAVSHEQNKIQTLLKLKQTPSSNFKQQIQLFNRLREYKKQKLANEAVVEAERVKLQTISRMKQLRLKEKYQQLRESLNDKKKQEVPITNVESIEGNIYINGQNPKAQSNIIHLQFSPEKTLTLSTIDPKIATVNGVKKYTFASSKIRIKNLMTNEQFTNSGKRQISSIPFVTLNYGISLSENGLAVSATRRARNSSRQKFEMQILEKRFKSHIPMVNSARVSNPETSQIGNILTTRSFFVDSKIDQNKQKMMESTIGTNKDMQLSILWKPRTKSQKESIRISNRQILKRQILQAKLCEQ